jgi:hypothetical protein
MKRDPHALGTVLQNARVTHTQLAEAIGVNPRTVGRWADDATELGEEQLRKVIDGLRAFDAAPSAAFAAAVGIARGDESTAAAPASAEAQGEAFRLAVYAAADDLDVPARKLRATLGSLLVSWQAAGLTLERARALLGSGERRRVRRGG